MLDELLLKQDYKKIPLRRTTFGHLELDVIINNIPALFLLDTGAASTVIDVDYAKDLQIEMEESDIKGGGVGTSELVIFQLELNHITMAEFYLENITICAVDLQHVRQSLLDKGEVNLPCGVIGADILITHKAIIDYENLALYLK